MVATFYILKEKTILSWQNGTKQMSRENENIGIEYGKMVITLFHPLLVKEA